MMHTCLKVSTASIKNEDNKETEPELVNADFSNSSFPGSRYDYPKLWKRTNKWAENTNIRLQMSILCSDNKSMSRKLSFSTIMVKAWHCH